MTTTPSEATANLYVEVVDHLGAVPAAEWDALTGDDNPFVEHAFLKALEDSGSVGEGTGWHPAHLLVRGATADGRPDVDAPLQGAAPMYVKTDSYGEYIFDWGWANAAHRAGIPFYPKLTSAVPFTPATGPRLLVRSGADAVAVGRALAKGAMALCEQGDLSGVHWLFCTEAEQAQLVAEGYSARLSRQFHWRNAGYGCFDDFLGALSSKRRKEIRRERRKAQSHGLDIRVLQGTELREDHWRALDHFYRRTVGYRGGMDYLAPRFFELLPERLAHRVVAVIAEADGRSVAGTLNFRKGDHLYGRYWGASVDLDALHFECCYYRLVDYAIAEGITLFEAGAQGHHKLARGFMPSATYSAHLIRHPGLRAAVDDFLRHEAAEVEREIGWLAEQGPFKSGC